MRLIKRIFRDKISQFPAYTPLNGPRACGRAFAVARIKRQYVTLDRSLVGKCQKTRLQCKMITIVFVFFFIFIVLYLQITLQSNQAKIKRQYVTLDRS